MQSANAVERERGRERMDTFMDKFAQRKKAQGMIDANAAADAAKMEKLRSQVSEYELLLQEMRKVNLKTAENTGQMHKAIQAGIEKIEAFQTENAALAEKDKALSEIKSRLEALLTAAKEQQEAILAETAKQQKISEEAKKQLETVLSQLRAYQDGFLAESKKRQETFSEEIKKQLETFSEETKKQLDEAFGRSEDFFHKESVKVYRNVQASMSEEFGKQTEALGKQTEALTMQMEALSAAQKESGKKQKAILPLTVFMLLLLLADIAIHLFNVTLF